MKHRITRVVGFNEIDKTKLSVVGGKGANLGELAKIGMIQVPDGFCVTTEVYKEMAGNNEELNRLLDQLTILKADSRNDIGETATKIRRLIEGLPIPQNTEEEITRHLQQLGKKNAYAVRSSATAEDLPAASFAGQQDTYLNITGKEAILKHISKCWASLFTERAVIYRMQNGFCHRRVHLAVVVQKMVFPETSGVLFTADPVTSNRKVLSVEAVFGLGEALVSGTVNADNYKVRNGELIDKKISIKKMAVYALKGGGTKRQELEPEKQNAQVLKEEQILQLERLGRKIEQYFGCPQDIEWCWADNTFYFVQSRSITTLFPVPETNDEENRVYVSVGHNQMMTDAMKPLGLSLFLLTTPAPMHIAGGRLFVDVAPLLASSAGRQAVIENFGKSDALIKDALCTIIERGDFIETRADNNLNKAVPPSQSQVQIENDPAIIAGLIRRTQTSTELLQQNIPAKSEIELFDFIQEDIQELKRILFDPHSSAVITAAMNASVWINEKMNEWLGEKNAADILSQSVPGNITSEMGLALMDVADVIRPYPDVIAYLQNVNDENFLDKLLYLNGGKESRDAIVAYLDKYGMRCAGEIDITRTRWSENPGVLIPVILSNIRNFKPGAGIQKFKQGRQEALEKEQELLDRLEQLPDGEQKSRQAKEKIGLMRNFIGYREYPKYGMMNRYLIYKQALLKEAQRIVQYNIIQKEEDIYYLSFEELREVVCTHKLDYQIISNRKDEYEIYERLTPPRVMTSEGEIIAGRYNQGNLPANAVAGLAVSSGITEGRARVILNMEEADIKEGDILVTTFTDPSWTPLFVSVKGLVTEVGGLMTHGAVIAREYGLPAVVGVENASKLIEDGQHIRVNGTEGYVEILET